MSAEQDYDGTLVDAVDVHTSSCSSARIRHGEGEATGLPLDNSYVRLVSVLAVAARARCLIVNETGFGRSRRALTAGRFLIRQRNHPADIPHAGSGSPWQHPLIPASRPEEVPARTGNRQLAPAMPATPDGALQAGGGGFESRTLHRLEVPDLQGFLVVCVA